MKVWEADERATTLVQQAKAEHKHLVQANIHVFFSDAKPLKNNKLVITSTSLASAVLKYKTKSDFVITISAEGWADLTDEQRVITIDEAVSKCGVQYLPKTVVVDGKKQKVKDDLGRIIYTDEIATDDEGNPKWKLNPPDASLYIHMLKQHKLYNEEAAEVAKIVK